MALTGISSKLSFFSESCRTVQGSKEDICEAIPELRPKGAMGAPIKALS